MRNSRHNGNRADAKFSMFSGLFRRQRKKYSVSPQIWVERPARLTYLGDPASEAKLPGRFDWVPL